MIENPPGNVDPEFVAAGKCGSLNTASGRPCGRGGNRDDGRCKLHHEDRSSVQLERMQRFLDELGSDDCGGTVRVAAHNAEIPLGTLYEWRRKYPNFAEAWAETVETTTDRIVAAMYHRAVVGVKEPIVYQGRVTGHTYRPSDTAAMFLLKARRPDEYRENVAVTVERDPNELAAIAAVALNADTRAAVRAAFHEQVQRVEIERTG